MKIVFCHYHLKTGGVTTVIKQQIDAIKDICEILVLTGEPPAPDFPADTVCIPGLAYDSVGANTCCADEVAKSIKSAVLNKWPSGCDLVHIHNPTLAKNSNLLKILNLLQQDGFNLFLQIHDFAEDGRPLSYYKQEEYPQDCHYGVINSRDYQVLIRSGLSPQGLHKISNMITPMPCADEKPKRQKHILYPIRAIRRKNIGEAILLSLFFKHEQRLSITQPPNSPSDQSAYHSWQSFVTRHALNIDFETGKNSDFNTLVSQASYMITTSITEGFGFTYLEPWTAHKMLYGRKIPEICEDFESRGILLDHLYPQLRIPLAWMDQDHLFETFKTCIKTNYRLFGFSIQESDISKALDHLTTDHSIDFGMLDEPLQQQVISHIMLNKRHKETLKQLNPCLDKLGSDIDSSERIKRNAELISNHYSRQNYGQTLQKIYSTILTTPVKHKINKQTLLAFFLDPKRFSLLKWHPYSP